VWIKVKLIYNFIHDENEEDLLFIRLLLARRPWEAQSNQVTNTWQAFTEAIRVQQDSKGNFPFQHIAPKTIRSRYNAYLGLEQYWAEKVDPEESYDDDECAGRHAPTVSGEIRNGINDLFEMVQNFNDAKAAERDGKKVKEWMEKGQVHEMKARALLHLDQAFEGVVATSKVRAPSGLSFQSVVMGDDVPDDNTKDCDTTNQVDALSLTPCTDLFSPKATAPRRTTKINKTGQGLLELEKVQKNLQELKEKKAQNRLEILKERENRKRKEAETAQLEQENTRLRLELQSSQIQANLTLQQQMMEQQLQMQQQMMAIISRLTETKKSDATNENEKK